MLLKMESKEICLFKNHLQQLFLYWLKALIELYDSKSSIQEIGIRHGEKKYETLVTSEEMVKATDLGVIIQLRQIIEI